MNYITHSMRLVHNHGFGAVVILLLAWVVVFRPTLPLNANENFPSKHFSNLPKKAEAVSAETVPAKAVPAKAMPAGKSPFKSQAEPANVNLERGPVHGIDVSHFQGDIDWAKTQAVVDFVFVKATEGITYTDPRFQQNMNALKDFSGSVGAYHFFEPGDDPIKQADNFLAAIKGHHYQLRPVLDVEISGGHSKSKIGKSVSAWLDYVEEKLNCKPIIYSYAGFWDSYLGSQFSDYPFWLADYAQQPTLPKTRKDMQLWQFSQKGSVAGISHHVDLNRASTWQALRTLSCDAVQTQNQSAGQTAGINP